MLLLIEIIFKLDFKYNRQTFCITFKYNVENHFFIFLKNVKYILKCKTLNSILFVSFWNHTYAIYEQNNILFKSIVFWLNRNDFLIIYYLIMSEFLLYMFPMWYRGMSMASEFSEISSLDAWLLQDLFAILFREKVQVFLLLNARIDVATWANDDFSMRHQGRWRACRTLLLKDLFNTSSSTRVLNTQECFCCFR